MPLSIRRKMLLTLYGCRVGGITSHPINKFLSSYHPIEQLLSQQYSFPALVRLFHELQSVTLSPASLPRVSMASKYQTFSLPVYCSLANSTKSDLSPAQWVQLFNNLTTTKYPNHHLIYTDGSYKNKSAGSGIWSPNFKIISRLPPDTSIFTAELYALYSAIKFLSSQAGIYLILSDSLSSIRALQSLNTSSHYLLSWISESLRPLSSRISIEWIPSHVGIHGNEQADHLANQSHSLTTINNIPTAMSELRRLVKKSYEAKWQQDWNNNSPALTAYKPLLGPTAFSTLPRPHQVALTRLRLGVCLLTHGHYFTKSPPQRCPHHRDTQLTIKHLIITCTIHEIHRSKIRAFCSSKRWPFTLEYLLSDLFPPELLIEYLTATDSLKLI